VFECLKTHNLKLEVLDLAPYTPLFLEHLMRIQAMIAHVTSGLWVRNGREISAQVETYFSVFVRDTVRDPDLFLLQVHI
jgi:hypothetical protein